MTFPFSAGTRWPQRAEVRTRTVAEASGSGHRGQPQFTDTAFRTTGFLLAATDDGRHHDPAVRQRDGGGWSGPRRPSCPSVPFRLTGSRPLALACIPVCRLPGRREEPLRAGWVSPRPEAVLTTPSAGGLFTHRAPGAQQNREDRMTQASDLTNTRPRVGVPLRGRSTAAEHEPTAPLPPTVFVLFGATGDLARRMVLPAFFELAA